MPEPTYPPLQDGFGRVATDLRLSVTDRCNFRCRYCMPPEGMPWLADDELLTDDELIRVTDVLVASGVRAVKVTGGEPLVRRDLPALIARIRGLDEDLDISLTTNGYLLAAAATELAAAGLDRVTVSCDSLLTHRFAELTLRDALSSVLDGLRVAAEVGLDPVKVNAVVMRDTNEDEVTEFARLARDTGYEVRFIEYMPLDAQGRWDPSQVVPAAEVLASIDEVYPLVAEPTDGPATTYRFSDGAPGRVGVIASVTEPFCSTCDRLRLTADGALLACLFATEETDIRALLRGGASDDDIAAAARTCLAGKWAGHRIGHDDFVAPSRSMSLIGG